MLEPSPPRKLQTEISGHGIARTRNDAQLHQNTFWQGRGGSLTHTISGIDMALWDILGKAAKMLGTDLTALSLDTVKMFAKDAIDCGFTL